MINGRKGFVATGLALAFACFACLALIGSLYSINNARTQVQRHIEMVQDYYLNEAILERTEVELRNNILYSIFNAYSEGEFASKTDDFEIVEVSRETELVQVSKTGDDSREFVLSFDVRSAVDIDIKIVGQDKKYWATLYSPTGECVFRERTSGTLNVTVDADEIYDYRTDAWGYGYGTYNLEIVGHPHQPVYAQVYFDQVISRVLEVKALQGMKRGYLVEVGPDRNSVRIIDDPNRE